MAAFCRYGSLLGTASALSGIDVEPVDCDEVATYKAIVSTDDEGFVVEITAPVCPVHEAHVVHNVGYKRSIKLREST